jgi:hypothetical protein
VKGCCQALSSRYHDVFAPVNCNNTGTLTADKHAHTCLKPRWRFSRAQRAINWLSKGLGRVSRSGKFSQKFVFERKSARKSINRLQLKRFKPGFLDSSKYFTSTNSKNFLGNSLIFKILHKFERAEKNFALWLLKKELYNCSTFWKPCFVLNFRYCWKFLAFFLVKIQLFSSRKQTSFRCRIFHSIRTWRPSWVASKMAAKLSFQFP